MAYYVGIDVGSTYVKIVVMDEKQELIEHGIAPTGINGKNTAIELLETIYANLNLHQSEIAATIATGYGRRMMAQATNHVTEIRAHARGARWISPSKEIIRTVIDVGGQDSKVIVLDEDGETVNFIMNDKCAAGTGRFLEALARVLEMDVESLGPLALQAHAPCVINSTCVVFAESEVISLLARGKAISDIIAGIHLSMANRIARMAKKAGIVSDVLLTGGGAQNPGLRVAFEDELMMAVHVTKYPQLNGAIGAALIAANGGS